MKFEKAEILLILRSYQVHPACFSDVVNEIKENIGFLSPVLRELYSSQSERKLVQRVREKFQRLKRQDSSQESDAEIR